MVESAVAPTGYGELGVVRLDQGRWRIRSARLLCRAPALVAGGNEGRARIAAALTRGAFRTYTVVKAPRIGRGAS
jgi:hypothetical protein